MNPNLLEERPHLVPAIISGIMLFLALAPWPYGYYQLLRFVVCGTGVSITLMALSWQKMWAVWLFGFIALLFNPLIPIHLSREIWQPINVICAVLFVVGILILKNPPEEKELEVAKEKKTKIAEKPKDVQKNNRSNTINLRRGFQRIVFVLAIVSGVLCAFMIVQEIVQENNRLKLLDYEIVVVILGGALTGYYGIWILWFGGIVIYKFLSKLVSKFIRWLALGFCDDTAGRVDDVEQI